MASSEKTNPATEGVLFGLAFYAATYWLGGPLLGVKAPVWTQGRRTNTMHTVNHVGFDLMLRSTRRWKQDLGLTFAV